MIYLDSSVALARLLFEPRAPALAFWQQRLVSSRLLEYEIWNRVHAYELSGANRQAARTLLMGIELFEMERTILARALEPWPAPVRTLDALHLATVEYLHRGGEAVEVASYDNACLPAHGRSAFLSRRCDSRARADDKIATLVRHMSLRGGKSAPGRNGNKIS